MYISRLPPINTFKWLLHDHPEDDRVGRNMFVEMLWRTNSGNFFCNMKAVETRYVLRGHPLVLLK